MEGELQLVLRSRPSHRNGDNDEMVDVHGNNGAGGLKYMVKFFRMRIFFQIWNPKKKSPPLRDRRTAFWTLRGRISEFISILCQNKITELNHAKLMLVFAHKHYHMCFSFTNTTQKR